MKAIQIQAGIALVLSLFIISVEARTAANRSTQTPTASAGPAYCLAGHNVGRIVLSISNNGTIGNNYSASGGYDCFTGEALPNLEYPKGSGNDYLFGGALWVGAIVGTDTLVSTGQDGWSSSTGFEFESGGAPSGTMQFRSTLDPGSPNSVGAISEQDYIGVYFDTCTFCPRAGYDFIDGRPHRPLNLQITQRSFSWSTTPVEDIVLIEYILANIGVQQITKIYVGLFVDADVPASIWLLGHSDDLSGFRREVNAAYMPPSCPATDTLDIAYIIDNDGDFNNPPFNVVPHVTGVRIIDAPAGGLSLSYNWWTSNGNSALDFGPQANATLRDLSTGGTGTPEGDRNKYHYLRNGEIDYNQVFTAAITDTDSTWVYPNQTVAGDVSRGLDTRYLLSTDPFDLAPGQEETVTFAYVAGENVHTDPNNWSVNLNDTYEPALYEAGLDFTDLDFNATMAEWVYDNPGVDTDSDGYAGEFRLCSGEDTIWFKGDGVPDLRANIPTEAPVFWVEPRPSSLYLRWNGRAAEETRDAFSRQFDFEGYRAYLADNPSPASFALIGSYDIVDFHRLVWDAALSDYRVVAPVLTVGDARCLYAPGGCADTTWHPQVFTRSNPYRLTGTDSIFYFVKFGSNAAEFGVETPFQKRFPAAPKPVVNWTADSVPVNLTDIYLTDDSYFKFFEYDFTINNLLPGKQHWVSITSFDHGTQVVGGAGSESPISGNAQPGIPLDSSACCIALTGNIDCDPNSVVDIADLTTLIDHLFIGLLPLCCRDGGNIDGDAQGVVDIADLTFLIDHLFITLTPTATCR